MCWKKLRKLLEFFLCESTGIVFVGKRNFWKKVVYRKVVLVLRKFLIFKTLKIIEFPCLRDHILQKRSQKEKQKLIRNLQKFESDFILFDLPAGTNIQAVDFFSMVEYKKATFMLESSKNRIEEDHKDSIFKISKLETNVKKEKNSNILLSIFLTLILLSSFIFWFVNGPSLKSSEL